MFKKYVDCFLAWLQQTLKLDAKYFAKNSILNGIQQIIGIICGLIISYFFGHFASKKLFGDYNLILSILGFLTIITLPGIDSYLIRSVGQKYDSSYLRGVRIKFLLSLLGFPILLGFSLFYLNQKQTPLGLSFLITSLFFPFLAPIQLFNEFFTGKLKFKFITLFLSISSLLSALFISVTIYFSHSLLLITLSYLIGIFAPSLIAFVYSLRFIKNTEKQDPDLIHIGLFNTLLGILPWSAAYLGLIILGVSLNTELLAIFTVANKLPTYVQKNLFVFYKPLTAKLALQSNKQHLETLKIHSLKLFLWGIILALPIYFLSPFIITTIFTAKYSESITIAKILSLAVIPLPISWVISDIIVFQKIKKPRLYTNIILNLIKIISYIILIPMYKLYGLVIVYIIDRYIAPIVDLSLIYLHNKKGESKKL